MKPPALLLQDLLRAHAVFLLHHAPSLSALFVRTKRNKFVSILSRYWDLFLSTWDVLLHGNPATNVFGAIKIAACGELGIGVGEEDRGSGEREVLEGFVDRTEGLVDLLVSKFGPSDTEFDADSTAKEKPAEGELTPKWLGTGDEPGAEDGAIFLGVGALSRKSLRDVAYWMEDLYSWGEDAYGVKDNPSSTRQPRKSRKHGADARILELPPKKVTEEPVVETSKQPDANGPSTELDETGTASPVATTGVATDEGGMTKFMQYLKLGYGTHWSLGASAGTIEDVKQDEGVNPDIRRVETVNAAPQRQSTVPDDSAGRFLIGLMGGAEESEASSPESGNEGDEYNSRVMVRALTVELDGHDRPETEVTVDLGSRKDSADSDPRFDSQDRNKTQKLRVVVYVSKPFVYTFLFRSVTDCLAWDTFYRSLHYQLAPLRKPLGTSTAYRPGRPDVGLAASNNIFDLIWDPRALTVHSTIPSIPDPLQTAQLYQQEGGAGTATPPRKPLPPWSRAEALGTHNQILNTYIATRAAEHHSDLERTCKTSRGWWVVWTRILDREEDNDANAPGGAPVASGSTTPRALTTPKQRASDNDDDGTGQLSSIPSNEDVGERAANTTMQPHPEPRDEGEKGEDEHWTGSRSPSPHSPPLPPPASQSQLKRQLKPKVDKEIFLIRRAGEHRHAAGGGLRALSTSYAEIGGGVGGGADANAGRLAQGIGVDTKRYIEGLLNLTR